MARSKVISALHYCLRGLFCQPGLSDEIQVVASLFVSEQAGAGRPGSAPPSTPD